MWSTIANFKENLNQMALEVHDADEELEIYRPTTAAGDDPSLSHPRTPLRFAQSMSPPIPSQTAANGFDSGFKQEIEQCKAEIRRLQSSENEIKALSVNYATLLKEKEEQLSRLLEENNSLRRNLEATNATRHTTRSETLNSNSNVLEGTRDQSPNMIRRTTQANSRSNGNHTSKDSKPKQDRLSNGHPSATYGESQYNREPKHAKSKEEEIAGLTEEHRRNSAAMQADYESHLELLRMELDKERDCLKKVQLKLLEEHNLNESFEKEISTFKIENNKYSKEMQKLKDDLNEKILEIKRLQSELTRRDTEEGADATVESLKLVIATLKKENARLKAERSETETSLNKNSRNTTDMGDSDSSKNHSANNEVHSSKSFQKEEAMSTSIKQLEQDLKVVRRERDKAVQELMRLKQHLLDKIKEIDSSKMWFMVYDMKNSMCLVCCTFLDGNVIMPISGSELEESDKMDEDSKLIEELRENCEYQRSQILHLEKALNQAIAGQEEVKKINSDELKKSIEKINDMEKKLANSMSTIDAKNMELLNLQTALGQYYAETEAKGRLERDLAHAREECTRLSERLKILSSSPPLVHESRLCSPAVQPVPLPLGLSSGLLSSAASRLCSTHALGPVSSVLLQSSSIKQNIDGLDLLSFHFSSFLVLTQTSPRIPEVEVMLMQNLEALQDSNEMVEMLKEEREEILVKSTQAEQMVSEENGQRIVIKLLVTYFQRGHKKEVLDLMVRMLGFSEEDKQRIGLAQQGVGKGVVRGVLGLPGRLVGGILGGSSEASSHLHSENHSFADLWVDFLLKETEERGKSESTHMKLEDDQHLRSPSTANAGASVSNGRKANMPSLFGVGSNIQTKLVQPEHLDREFSTIPLTPSVAPFSETTSRTSRH
ncbi:hypothetical protein Sjap_005095 [Stephania japonica]|uniref:GRIP domain-containing protein n=1 Tax=Stephania japonica TaxID=461633 RepID=A0AAP0PIE8_9MAGN